MQWTYFHRLASPKWFYQISGKLLPWFSFLSLSLLTVGLGWGLFFAPVDHIQGNSYRIIFIHVPAASLALGMYASIAVASAIYFIWKIKLADVAAKVMAPVGSSFCLLALLTGAIWGKPTWGTWWVWDARLTSMLILLFLYLGLIALRGALENREVAGRACALLAIVGVVNLPIIKYSVDWWNSLHQGASITLIKGSTIDPQMLWPLLLSIAGFYCFCGLVVLLRMRLEILSRERKTAWVAAMLGLDGLGGA